MKFIHLTKIGLGGLAGLAWSLATFSVKQKESNGTRLTKQAGCVARASWGAAVPAASWHVPKRCREPHSKTLPRLLTSLFFFAFAASREFR
jgi:hypothetical protein